MNAGEFLKNAGIDGRKWAQEFSKTAVELGYPEMDEGWLIGWFANAIEAARAEGREAIQALIAAEEVK